MTDDVKRQDEWLVYINEVGGIVIPQGLLSHELAVKLMRAADHDRVVAEKNKIIHELHHQLAVASLSLETARRVAYNRGVHDGIQGTYGHDGEDYVEKDEAIKEEEVTL